jgi:hypothetical protein
MALAELDVGEQWLEWYGMTPAERWQESLKLWSFYLDVGGSLDPAPDTQSPFDDAFASGPVAPHGRAGVRLVRRGGV